MELNPLPKRIYKYTKVDQYFYDLLINAKLWFSNPQDFNDPFDNNISFQKDLNEAELRSLMKSEDFKKLSRFDEETIVGYFKNNPAKLDQVYTPLKQLV